MTQPVTPSATSQTATHLGPAKGIPSGPSAADLMQQIQDMQAQMNKLLALQQPEAAAPRELKTYYHQTPGSVIIVTRKGTRGENIPESFTFIQGRIETEDADVQDFLDEIVDAPGVPIYSRSPRGQQDEAIVKAAREVVKSAARTIDKLGAEAGVIGS